LLAAFSSPANLTLPRERTFDFDYLTRIPAVPPGAHLRLWIPVPGSDPHQEIADLIVQSPVPYKTYRDPEYGNRYIYLELKPGSQPAPFDVRMHFQTRRVEHRVDLTVALAGPNGTKPSPGELARSLRPDRLVPTDGLIAALAEQETRGLSRPLDKARAIYNYVVSTMRYDRSGEGWGRGDALFACNARRGNCTDFHALFIGMMRAVGIPARFEIGFPLPPDRAAGEIPGYHCWAQFYIDEIGWVPVDASEAWKNPALRDYFFGAHDANRVFFTRGRDIRLNPAQQGDPLNYFIYPYAELDGNPLPVESRFSFREASANGKRAPGK
jgi:transglutaminase-like putative cysteine protease